jgi:peptide/nickel transport system substrate-binding protein
VLGDAADMIEGVPYDPAVATQLLEEAGWTAGGDGIREKDGRRLALAMIVGYPSAEIHRPMPEFVQAQLRDVGVELQIVQTPDVADYSETLTRGEGDLWAEVGNQVDADPCYLPAALFSSPTPEGGPEANSYANAFAPGPEFDAFIDECSEAATIEELQEAAAKALNLLIDEQHVVLPLAGVVRLYGASEKVLVFEPHPSQFNQRWDTVDVMASE